MPGIMLMIRLQRVGRRNHAEFRVVVTEKARAAKTGNIVEQIGNYNPHTDEVSIDKERVEYWMSKGAQPSDTMHNLLVSQKLIKGEKRNVLPKKAPIVKESEEGETSDEKEEKKEEAPADESADKADEPAEETKEDTPADDADEAKKEEKKQD
jgi:small subunit ribosomal protein S16